MKIDQKKITSIILAAGKGTRMGAPEMQKVCFPVGDTPAIVRSLRTYSSCGIHPHAVVVGHGAEQVMEIVRARFDDAFYAFQAERKGTGHAAKQGAKLFSDLNYKGDVLVVAGDKIIEAEILQRLITTFYEQQSDLAFIVGDCESYPTSGRVVYSDDHRPLAIVEVFDIASCTLLGQLWLKTEKNPVTAEEAARMARRTFPGEKKLALALGPIWKMIKAGKDIKHSHVADLTNGKYPLVSIRDGLEMEAERIQQSQLANLSVYLIRAQVLFEALDKLSSDNAQQEEYLTDIVAILSASEKYRLHSVQVDDPHQVMAFNSRKELEEINTYLRAKRRSVTITEPPTKLHRPSQWLQAMDSDEMLSRFDRLYNDNRSTSINKLTRLKKLVMFFKEEYGDIEAMIARAPGRVNLMGRHVDHQGGHCNLIAIDREVFMVAAPRSDDSVYISNLDSIRFPKREFCIGQLLTEQASTDWMAFVDSEYVGSMPKGDWSQYIKASTLRLQAYFNDRKLKGMNIAVSGDIPIAAGLSSSSALVVTTAETVVALNELQLDDQKFVDLCGEGEWFVGTRGGHADHAAMKMGKRGRVVQVGFYPFTVKQTVPFPDDHFIVICDSHGKAFKSAESRTMFNQRVACYQLGRHLFKNQFPQYKSMVTHLRDMVPQALKIELKEFYRIIKMLPREITKEELYKLLPENALEPICATHSSYTGNYPIREIVLYGLAECERSSRCADLLKKEQITEFGELMNISHDGDRVVKFDAQWDEMLYHTDCSDGYFESIEALAAQGDSKADLHLQPGSYRCSTPEIDLIVDLAKSVKRVKGAQLSGAGLGGCAMVLVEESAVEELTSVLTDKYYATRDLEPAMAVCTPVTGSGILEL